jgi:hypothetical protein
MLGKVILPKIWALVILVLAMFAAQSLTGAQLRSMETDKSVARLVQ